MVHALSINIESQYDDNFLAFNLFILILWIISELVPIVHLFKIHYQNFKSFEDEKDELVNEVDVINDTNSNSVGENDDS